MEASSQSRKSYWPEVVYVGSEAKNDSLTKRVLSRLPGVEVCEVEEGKDPITEQFRSNHAGLDDAERFSLGKRKLFLTRYLGEWMRACPGTSQHVCCNLWVVNPGEGCPLDCTYCYLQSYLRRNPTLKLYTNTGDMLRAIEDKVSSNPNRLFRIGTGELIDSLVWDDLTESTLELVPFFSRLPNAVLELKTKSDCVGNLLKLSRSEVNNTVISWSVNARQITQSDERFTASLDARIRAAEQVVDAGYRVGFHFDPLIHFQGWQDAYRETIREIFTRIPSSNIAWISVSSLRYQREMQEVMQTRFPESAIPYGEQFLAKDGKLRYFQPIRFQMINFVWQELKTISKDLPVYMCMESAAAWREINHGAPAAGSELKEVFSRRGRLPIISAQSDFSLGEDSASSCC